MRSLTGPVRLQTGDDGPVRGGKIELWKFGGIDPSNGEVLERMRDGALRSKLTDKGKHLDRHVAIIMGEGRKAAENNDFTAKFLAELADKCG